MSKSRRSKPPLHIVLLAVPPILELDLTGALTVFKFANVLHGSATLPYRITVASGGASCVIGGDCGLEMKAPFHFTDLGGPIDTLIVIGGDGSAASTPLDSDLMQWLKEHETRVRRMASVCTAAFVLAKAGLLDGRRAATHWAYADRLQSAFVNVRVDSEAIWVKDGNVYTSAGVTAGIDLSLALVEEDIGSELALRVARQMVVFLKRTGGQRQFSVALAAEAPSSRTLVALLAWIAEHLGDRLTVESLASQMAMSPRNFSRVFRAEIGVTPARYIRKARVEAARTLLEQTRRPVEDVAACCGFGSAEVMRRAFLDEIGVPPTSYRFGFETGPLQAR
ncbi:GlxA family transcriptional regulator [Microvirga guangxiensis]|uniref:Transcriptional regulator GlxA family, contains an amidase domain and an AraC-type DNA-binding HTH domain n=1 Tax=Microvirga guangxiensis TaxID=549386 RepID=A0A1G5KLB1_9HYPH|nr:GlxA family transcriptional regulator [Microvirga guangxiensis]SCZ00991.1 Transcriptional regulator GlxA family, contains an amidase domain and an AraC-type DNA-binding HTH domain [Microvirga guangxiensis]